MGDPSLLQRLQHESHVWFTVPECIQDRARLRGFLAMLAEDETRRHNRFQFSEDRHRFLISHALVRQVLSRYCELTPEEWHFSRSEHGKPEICNPGAPRLRFNLTHTVGLAACVVNLSGECGIDAEQITGRHNPLGVARRMFSQAEYLHQRRLTGQAQLDYFFQRWTLREAYVKARGIGIRFPTRKLLFHVDADDRISVEFEPEIDDCDENWQLQLLRPTERHVAAVAIARRGQQPKTIVAQPFRFSD
jgi:4'-phosphopantetheinyl transferase